MRLIDADALLEYLMINMGWHDENGIAVDDSDEKRAIFKDLINGLPTVDAVPVVRCKDCKCWDKSTIKHYEDVFFGSGDTAECRMFCDMDSWGEFPDEMRRTDCNWFCADGEKVSKCG